MNAPNVVMMRHHRKEPLKCMALITKQREGTFTATLQTGASQMSGTYSSLRALFDIVDMDCFILIFIRSSRNGRWHTLRGGKNGRICPLLKQTIAPIWNGSM